MHGGALLAKGKQENQRYREKYSTQHSCKFSRNLQKVGQLQSLAYIYDGKKTKSRECGLCVC